jgi:predicted RecB family nuclease
LRIFLRQQHIEESPPGPYEQILERLGQDHEKKHLVTFPSVADLSSVSHDQRIERTTQEVEKGAPVIYQGLLRANTVIRGVDCEISGIPDFLVKTDEQSYIVRDSKMSRRINEKDHPEILLQMGIYGWLYEQTFGKPPGGLQVHNGMGDIVDVDYDGGATALASLEDILNYRQLSSEPYSPVGWSKCNGCGFFGHCWPQVEESRDVAIIFGVDQGLALALREQGIETADGLLGSYNEEELADLHRPWGNKTRRVGKQAGGIIRMAHALTSGQEILIQAPSIPEGSNYVMFDLEGLPPHLDELDKIYLWGIQVFGEKPGEYLAATAGFGKDGDKQGWEDFLQKAEDVFREYGDISFVHWHHYERVRIDMYVERFGDTNDIAARVRKNLLDLLPITQKSIALPLPSYSLKVVEQYIGFERTQDEYGGQWAMARYIEATEMEDEKERTEIMDEILTYNKEDLEATWAVLQWLKSKAR